MNAMHGHEENLADGAEKTELHQLVLSLSHMLQQQVILRTDIVCCAKNRRRLC